MEHQSNQEQGRRKKNYWMMLIMVLLVLALGLTAINQGLGYYYKSKFLQTPCELCAELNPQYQECFKPHIIYKEGEVEKINITISEDLFSP